ELEAAQGIEGVTVQENLIPQLICDDNFDGEIYVDLTFWEEELISETDLVDFYYYLTETDAIAGTNPITGDVQNYLLNGQLIFWVALVNADGCKEIRFIEFQLNPELENLTQQEDLAPQLFCDEDFDGEIYVDLTIWETELTNNPDSVTFEYYLSESDAIAGTNPIAGDLENYPLNQMTIWIVIMGESGCKEKRYVEYEMGEQLETNGVLFQLPDVCLLLDNSLDLTQLESGISDETSVDYLYYETIEQAEAGGNNNILNPANFTVTEGGSIFVRLESN